MAGTDMIKTPPLGVFGKTWHHWDGATWPPPERMLYVEGKTSGMSSFLSYDSGANFDPDFTMSFHIIELRRLRASEAPEPAPANEHWFRGAEYELATVSTERTLSEHGQ